MAYTTANPIHSPFFLKLILNRNLLAIWCIFSVAALTFFAASPVKGQTGTTIIGFDPANYAAQSVGESFKINLTIANVMNLWEWWVGISWNPNILNLTACNQGPFLTSIGNTFWTPISQSTIANGTISPACTSETSPQIGASGNGTLATLTFTILKQTIGTQITLFNTSILGPEMGSNYYHPSIDHQDQNATVTLIIHNNTTTIVADAGQPQTVNQGTQVVLNGSQTSSSDPNETTYTWTFTDGTLKTLQGQVVNYTFNTPGTYNVTLSVQDPYGNSSDWTEVTVRDTTLPVARISIQDYIPGQDITAGESITFDSQSTDPYSNIVSYTWDMGDGSPTIGGDIGSAPSVLHSYSNPGKYNVTLTVTDAAGMNATTTFAVSVDPSPKTISATSLNLPTYLLGILCLITILALGGSAFWLRKTRTTNQTSNTASTSTQRVQSASGNPISSFS